MLLPWDDMHQGATRMLAPLSAYQTPCHRGGSAMDWLLAERHISFMLVEGEQTAGTKRYWEPLQ